MTVRVGANLFTFCTTGGPQFVGHALALGLHASVDRLGDGFDVIDAGDPYIHHINPPGFLAADFFEHFTLDIGHQRFTFERQQLFDSALVDLLLKCIADHTVELTRACGLVGPHITDVLGRFGNTPTHIPVDHDTLFFSRQHRLGIGAVKRKQALVDVGHILKGRWQFEVQARLGNDFLDLAQRIHHAKLTLINHKQRGTG